MKKIMFNERYGLQQAVLDRKKTMTRRILKCPKKFKGVEDVELEFHRRLALETYYNCVVVDGNGHELGQLPLPYEIGDIVPIAQSYENILCENGLPRLACEPGGFNYDGLPDLYRNPAVIRAMKNSYGYRNKMYVKSELMPHHIRITDLWFERLQDISDEDCLKEGIRQSVVEYGEKKIVQWTYFGEKITTWYDSPCDAFAAMIERICGSGTWAENPLVIAYTFELID